MGIFKPSEYPKPIGVAPVERSKSPVEKQLTDAVIPVRSYDEITKALSDIYAKTSGIGTIQIAADIVINKPIKLKQFKRSESNPREIKFTAVAGAKLINGSTSDTGTYNYNNVSSSAYPVFDFGPNIAIDASDIDLSVTTYTFQNLIINSENSKRFGTIFGFDSSYVLGYIPRLSFKDSSVNNCDSILGSYVTNNSTEFGTILFNPIISDIKFKSSTSRDLWLNLGYVGAGSGKFSSVGILDVNNIIDLPKLIVDNNNIFTNNTIESIATQVKIVNMSSGNPGANNSYINLTLSSDSLEDEAYELINCEKNVLPAISAAKGLSIVKNAYDGNLSTETRFMQYARGGYVGIDNISALTSSHHVVDWNVSLRYNGTGSVNTYHIKTNFSVNASGVGTIIDNSTLFASEQEPTTLGIIPEYDAINDRIYIQPISDTGGFVDTTCAIKMVGFKLPTSNAAAAAILTYDDISVTYDDVSYTYEGV